ncbi:hypothetical protein [uncultured Winogradskyella sp.]|uniref:hypothetical protein n=1 Tax=uncultured Winogradskyella sp. TaxID=395353 RepID=UPI002605D29C|nr:hypothetical protein [uncultured Winogradskyella sp.]
MKNQFKLSLLMLITSAVVYAQKTSEFEMDEKYTIYKENFTTNDNTTLVLNLKSTTAQVLESPDDKVYIEYTKEFRNTRKKKIEAQLKLLEVSGKKEGNKITYSSRSRMNIGDRMYSFHEILIGRFEGKQSLKDSLPKAIKRKSLDSILHEIKDAESLYRNKILGGLTRKPRTSKQKKRDQIIISKMVIKIPKNIHVRATLENSNLVFMNDFYNRATMNVRNSRLRFKSLGNALNNFDFDNGYFNAEEVSGGSYSFANAKEVRIGHLSNSILNTEFTKVEIGEIGKKVDLIDFTGEYFLYNWTEDFNTFNLNSEYSKIHIFKPKTNYGFKVFGNNIKNITKGFNADLQSNASGEKYLVLEKKPNENELSTGQIDFDMVNGIIYSYED